MNNQQPLLPMEQPKKEHRKWHTVVIAAATAAVGAVVDQGILDGAGATLARAVVRLLASVL